MEHGRARGGYRKTKGRHPGCPKPIHEIAHHNATDDDRHAEYALDGCGLLTSKAVVSEGGQQVGANA